MVMRVTEVRCSEDRQTLRTVFVHVRKGVDVELARWRGGRGGRVEVYVLEDGIYMFVNYLDQFEVNVRAALYRMWDLGEREIDHPLFYRRPGMSLPKWAPIGGER